MDFEALANEHKDAVYRQLVCVCGNREDAEDVLRDVQELGGEETAAKLNISSSAMKSRLHRARANVRRYMDAALVPAKNPTASSRQS